MLEFYAREYLEISYNLGQMLCATYDKPVEVLLLSGDRMAEAFKNLAINCRKLGLTVTDEHCAIMFAELGTYKDGKMVPREDLGEDAIRTRVAYHIETIYSVFRAELSSMKIRAIPKEKNIYCDPEWLVGSVVFPKYPETVDEFQRAGRCFAFGENTACIFHLMRVVDFLLRTVAGSIGASYDARNWKGIGQAITKKMEEKYQSKTDDWKKAEPFYAEILTDILAISRGHRNPALHELEKKYDEREAHYMLTVIEGFATHVASNL